MISILPHSPYILLCELSITCIFSNALVDSGKLEDIGRVTRRTAALWDRRRNYAFFDYLLKLEDVLQAVTDHHLSCMYLIMELLLILFTIAAPDPHTDTRVLEMFLTSLEKRGYDSSKMETFWKHVSM